jgi:hypothetical protein
MFGHEAPKLIATYNRLVLLMARLRHLLTRPITEDPSLVGLGLEPPGKRRGVWGCSCPSPGTVRKIRVALCKHRACKRSGRRDCAIKVLRMCGAEGPMRLFMVLLGSLGPQTSSGHVVCTVFIFSIYFMFSLSVWGVDNPKLGGAAAPAGRFAGEGREVSDPFSASPGL